MRVGMGYDIHPLKKGEKLILGGVEIPFEYGLEGHSDADILTHALMDAILGAMARGDIGQHFPDNDDKYENIKSLKLLKKVKCLMQEEKFILNNADLILIAERPRIKPYSKKIITNLCEVLAVQKNKVNFKATTSEKIGFVGREEGMAAKAIVSLQEEK